MANFPNYSETHEFWRVSVCGKKNRGAFFLKKQPVITTSTTGTTNTTSTTSTVPQVHPQKTVLIRFQL